jgi:hypothetical protein
VPTPQPAERTYAGPLYVTDAPTHPSAGAAGQIVDCKTWGHGSSVTTPTYGDGATTDRPEQALYEEGDFDVTMPGELHVAGVEDDRVLYVLEVGGAVKEAVIVRDGPATEDAGGPGWYVESGAICDSSELPRSYTDSIGLQIWTDPAGHPVPTTTIQAWRGPEHCDWESMTFLTLGKATYIRDPLPELSDYFAEPYEAHATLPAGAIDTGYHRDGNKLWLSADGQRAYVGTPDDVEVWPREQQPLGCD